MKFAIPAFVFGMVVLAPGCGGNPAPKSELLPDMGKVSGKITLDDVPLTVGDILFQKEDRKSFARGFIDKEGNYVVKNASPGNYKAALIFADYAGEVEPVFDSEGNQIRSSVTPKGPGVPELPELEKTVPAAYKSLKTSGLTFTIAAGENRFDIKLVKGR